jgi:hypothetical protein
MCFRYWRGWRVAFSCFAVLLGVIFFHAVATAQIPPGGMPIAIDTDSGFLKSNQSKIFYHDAKWWAIAFNAPDSRWYIWKFSGSAWTKATGLDKSSTRKYDAVVNAAKNKLYLLGSHGSASEIRRFSYVNGNWAADAGFPVNPAFVNTDGNNPLSMVQAKNGDLWIFRIEANKLQAKRSKAADDGKTWSATPINLKSGLKTATGITDAVAFSSGGNNFIGVAFGESDVAGAKFGFLLHQDAAADTVWKDETASLTYFGAERGNNQICLTKDDSNNVYLLTKNGNALANDPRNTLYKRLRTGVWQKFRVNTDFDWKSPALAYDAANNWLFVMGINSASQMGEYKTCFVGQEPILEKTAAQTIFSGAGATFAELSAPPSGTSLNVASGLMVAADNNAAKDIWYNRLTLKGIAPVIIGPIKIAPNQVNANATCTIPLNLSGAGALAADSGTIKIVFPPNTLLRKNIAAQHIAVKGTPCKKVAVDSATRRLTITTPVNLTGGPAFSIVINIGAGLLNPTLSGPHQLKVSTSEQPLVETSTNYNLIAATSTVNAATVKLSTNEADSCANYTIAFTLGINGRLLQGTSTITVVFDKATKVADGALTGVKINNVAASATGNATTKTVIVKMPAALALNNSAAVTLLLPASTICNPAVGNEYKLTVNTSVETKPIASLPYKITGRLVVSAITVTPPMTNANAAYAINLKLSGNGALTAGAGKLGFRFPNGTKIPNTITPNLIMVNGTAATATASNSALREVIVTVPANLANNQSVVVKFNLNAGLINPPTTGDYVLQAWTSAQPEPVNSPKYTLTTNFAGSPISTTTASGYMKSNQSKVFYHDTQWWVVAFDEPENKWYIWKFNGVSWAKNVGMDKGAAFAYDVVVNAGANKIYLLAGHQTLSRFLRYSYAGGAWKIDAGFPVDLNDFVAVDSENPISLVQAKNGDLWIFRINAGVLQAKRSLAKDGGAKWLKTVAVKSGLQSANGITDAVAFSASGKNYIGVGYGENGATNSRFGFLVHQLAGADSLWKDESAALAFFGAERGLNRISMTTDAEQNVYLFTQNTGVTVRNTLYKRSNLGVWKKFRVNSGARNWKTPVLAIDATNKALYFMGVNAQTLVGEYKSCGLGEEAQLDTASVKILFNVANGQFDNLSAPAANVNAASGLMIGADNAAANDIYYRHLVLGGTAPLSVGNIKVVSNQINANATYTIPLQLSSLGGLEADTGVLNFIFPANTFVPSNMPAPAVKVDGVPAKTVLANSTTRQVTVTTPVKLLNDHNFSVVFDSAAGAGLLNSTTIGSTYRLTAWTSAQPKQVDSPPFSLMPTTTKVTSAAVKVFPPDPDSLAEYQFAFNLGAHGRTLPGSSTIRIKFGAPTKVRNGAIPNVKLNGKIAAATADSLLRRVTVTVPADLELKNNSSMTLFIPRAKIRNPNIARLYNVVMATSVETTFVASQPYAIKVSRSIGAAIPNTKKSFDRNNQSKMFYHGGFWWVTAQSKVDLNWYLWKFNGTAWTQNVLIASAGNSRPDCILDASNNKAYILVPGSSITYFVCLKYSSGKWTVDLGYPVAILDFKQVSDRGLSLTRAKNGHFWIFRAADSTLTAKYSSDAGKNWSRTITIKKHLHNRDALTDATPFSHVTGNYVGVGYAENSTSGAIYGFLRHLDTDPDSIWKDETRDIPQFIGTNSDDHLSMLASNGEVLMLVKTNGGKANVTDVGLLRRNWNGGWNQFPVQTTEGWARPVMVVDETNKRLYISGSREGSVKVGVMKKCNLGDYGALLTAPVDTIFRNEAENFLDASLPAHPVNGTTNLLICSGNDTRDELWFNLIKLGGAKKMDEETPAVTEESADEDFEGVQVFPNPFNPQTSFRFKLKEQVPVKLQIFNLNGQLVRTLVDEGLASGIHVRRWNGRNADGRPAATGLYFYRLHIGQKIFTGRIQMVK